VEEQRRQPDVRSGVDDDRARVEAQAAAQVAARAEDLPVEVLGLLAVEVGDLEAVRKPGAADQELCL
jgi:hypothetical protein